MNSSLKELYDKIIGWEDPIKYIELAKQVGNHYKDYFLRTLPKANHLNGDAYLIEYGKFIVANTTAAGHLTKYQITNPSFEKGWLIHITKREHVKNILKNGILGAPNPDRLAATQNDIFHKRHTKTKGFNFAYDLDKFYEISQTPINIPTWLLPDQSISWYGDTLLLFNTESLKVYHVLDKEYQHIFYNDIVNEVVILDYDSIEQSNKTVYQWKILNGPKFYDVDVNKCIQHAIQNFNQYKFTIK